MNGNFVSEVLGDLFQGETGGLGEEEVYNCKKLDVGPFQITNLGVMMIHTWNKECGPADNDQVVFPANVTEAHGRSLQENKGCYTVLACVPMKVEQKTYRQIDQRGRSPCQWVESQWGKSPTHKGTWWCRRMYCSAVVS